MSDSFLPSNFPIDIIHEIVRNSDVPTLATWCLVSKELLSFAGPRLYENVSLSRAEDLVPFLRRLCSPQECDVPRLLPLRSLKRLEVLSLPPAGEDDFSFLEEEAMGVPLSFDKGVLAIRWDEAEDEEGRELQWAVLESWMSVLLKLLRPRRYEEFDSQGEVRMRLSGVLIPLFIRLEPGQNVLYLYEEFNHLSRLQEILDTSVVSLSADLPVELGGRTSDLVASLTSRFEDQRKSLEDRSLFGFPKERLNILMEAQTYLAGSQDIVIQLRETFMDLYHEFNRLHTLAVTERQIKRMEGRLETLGAQSSVVV